MFNNASVQKKKLFVSFFVSFCSVFFYQYPVLFCFLLSLFSLILVNERNFRHTIFLFCLFFFFFGMAMDPTEYVSDYSRYYLSFYRPFDEILFTGKLYRYSVFSVLKFLGLSPQVYTGLSIFLIFYITLTTAIKFSLLNQGLTKNKIFFLVFIVLCNIPSATVGNFESTLSITFLFSGFYYLCKEDIKKASALILFSSLTHPAAIPLSLLLLPGLINREFVFRFSGLMTLFGFSIIGLFLLFDASSSLPYISHIKQKLVFFLFESDWSKYLERRDFEILVIGLTKAILAFYCIVNLKKYQLAAKHLHIIGSVSLFLFPFFVSTLVSRTLAERYLYFGFFIYYPLIVTVFTIKRSKKLLSIILIVSCAVFVAPQNVIVYGVLILKATTSKTLSLSIPELVRYKYEKASDPEKFRVIESRG